MGRAKVRMEPITNHRKRMLTFHKRKDGLIKKAFELTQLCDVNVSLIICIDNQEPESFPQDPCKFNDMIDLYKRHQNMDLGKIGHYSLSDFLNDRKIKIEKELAMAKKKNIEAKYPTWFDFLNDYSEVQLRQFACGLGRKIDIVKSRIESLKNSKIQNHGHHAFYPGTILDVQSSYVTPSVNPNPLPMTIPNDLVYFPSTIMKPENPDFSLKPQTPMMIPMNYNYNDFDFEPSHAFADQNNFMMQSENPKLEKLKLLTGENDNNDCYDYVNSGFQPYSPMMIPINNTHPVIDTSQLYADQYNVSTQSENPNSELLKLPTSEDDDWYDFEDFSLPQSPMFWLSPEIPDLPPFMQMDPVSTSVSSSQMTENNEGANGNDYHYLV